jgi:hypothetical protein
MDPLLSFCFAWTLGVVIGTILGVPFALAQKEWRRRRDCRRRGLEGGWQSRAARMTPASSMGSRRLSSRTGSPMRGVSAAPRAVFDDLKGSLISLFGSTKSATRDWLPPRPEVILGRRLPPSRNPEEVRT